MKADALQRLPRAMSRYVWALSVKLHIQGAAIVCQDIPIAVLTIRVERKKQITESAKESLGLHELKQNKPWFDEECLGFLDRRKQAKMQWIQDPSQNNVDNLNNVRREVTRHFRNKNKAYMRAKIEELETNNKIQNIMDLYRGINDFK